MLFTASVCALIYYDVSRIRTCFDGWLLAPFLPLSFLTAVGVGGAGVTADAGVGGPVSSLGVSGSSSGISLPFRFLPCRRQGSSGVLRIRTSHGNLIEASTFSFFLYPKWTF